MTDLLHQLGFPIGFLVGTIYGTVKTMWLHRKAKP